MVISYTFSGQNTSDAATLDEVPITVTDEQSTSKKKLKRVENHIHCFVNLNWLSCYVLLFPLGFVIFLVRTSMCYV